MSVDILVEIVLKSGLAAAAALLLVTQLKGLPAAQRAWIAHIGLLLTLLIPLFVLIGPDLQISGPWSRTLPAVSTLGAALPTAPLTAPGPDAWTPAAAAFNPGLLVLGAWAVGAGALIVALGLGLVRLLGLQRDAAVLTDRDWLCALAQTQHAMGLKQGTALLRSERLASPVSWGLLRPTIVLSPAALKSPEKATAILAHELAHVVRMDWANLLISRLATALFWFNPLVWMLAWQAHELREEAADDVVLRSDVEGPDYASMLVDFARGEGRAAGLAAHGMAPGKGSLRRRLMRVLDRDARRDPARPLWVAGCAIGALVVAAPLAAFTPVDRISEAAAASSSSAEMRNGLVPVDVSSSALVSDEPPTAAAAAGPTGEETGANRSTGADNKAVAVAFSPVQSGSGERLSPEILAQMRIHGVTPQWIASLEREIPQMRRLSAQQMVALAVHRVTPAWIRSMREAGYGDLTHEQIVSLAVHRVSPAYIRELEGAGYRNLPVDDLVAFRIHDVTADYIRGMEAEGLRMEPEDIVRARIGKRSRRPPPTQPPAPPAPPAPPSTPRS